MSLILFALEMSLCGDVVGKGVGGDHSDDYFISGVVNY